MTKSCELTEEHKNQKVRSLPSTEKNLNRDLPGGAVVKTRTHNAGGPGSIPGRGTKTLHVKWCSQKKKKI